MNERRPGWFTLSSGVLALVACQSAPTRIYTLQVAAPAARSSYGQAPALRVDNLSVPAAWDRIEILQPTPSGTLKIDDFDHWSASLRQAARQALSADLSERLPSGSVIYPRLPKSKGALGIDVDILEFDFVASHASMQASWVITPAVGSGAAKRGEALLQNSMPSAQPAAVVRAWSELLGQLADHIAADAVLFQASE